MSAHDVGGSTPPWILQQHFNGEIDLDRELNSRFKTMPVLSIVKLRRLDATHALALLMTQDGASTLRVEVDLAQNTLQLVFTMRSMLALKFTLRDLGDSHRMRWLEGTRTEPQRPSFCWGPSRWESDHLITVSHPYYANIYAFSDQFEAAVRLTTEAKDQLLDWLTELWKPRSSLDATIPTLTTW
jgi:hypothetical protein